jgi:[ribosomal protein S5]-alanine N-acetyltransferase
MARGGGALAASKKAGKKSAPRVKTAQRATPPQRSRPAARAEAANLSNVLPELRTSRLRLLHVQPSMAVEFAHFMVRNEAHLRRWDPPRSADIGTAAHWRRQLALAVREFRAGSAVRWALFDARGDEHAPLIGRINFNQIFRGPFQSCVLGYQIDAQAEGKGLMFEALTAALDDLFCVRGLHRVQAAYVPENVRSGKVLERLGFERIGLARRYLFIDGAWRDHVLMALTNPAFDPSRLPG